MPKISYLNTKQQRILKAQKLIFDIMCIIVGHCEMKNIKLCEILNVSNSTALKKRANPGELSLNQLIECCVKLDIPCEDIRAKLQW